ncbi:MULTISPECIES: recombinase family protein [Flavobacteriaceae]|uniref:recombinase family protein n=1 Tax=Flavobacteriaceae TaxID=49546 RepID=UPI00149108DB|nr:MULTISPECIES: recombinase family protein [Allomuricauda]MDC6364815.1 recombinase family protein [Muricauda sp. AC10]
MQAVIYARVSSTDDSQSYDRQVEDLKPWATTKNLEVVEVFADKISGYRKSIDDRVEFNKMLEYIDANNIKNILVTEVSRLSRRTKDAINIVYDCNDKGICIFIKNGDIKTLNDDGTVNQNAKMTFTLLSSIADMEAGHISNRVRSGKRNAAAKGLGFNQKIYGYDKGEDGKPVINEDEAILVRTMFDMVLEGHGTRKIAKYLNANYETKEWKIGSINSILRNTFYKGDRRYKVAEKKVNEETVIEYAFTKVPPIVNPDKFDEVQQYINDRKRFVSPPTVHTNPFASMIKCQCGAVMHQVVIPKKHRKNSKHRGGGLNLYRCSKKCGVKSVNRDFLIDEVRKVLEGNAQQFKEADVKAKLKKTIEVDLANITQCERQIRSAKMKSEKNYDRFLEDKITEERYDEHEQRFNTEIEKLQTEIKKLKANVTATNSILNNKIVHYSKDLEVFKSQVERIVKHIEVDESFAKVHFKSWFPTLIPIYRGAQLQRFNNGTLGMEITYDLENDMNTLMTLLVENLHLTPKEIKEVKENMRKWDDAREVKHNPKALDKIIRKHKTNYKELMEVINESGLDYLLND